MPIKAADPAKLIQQAAKALEEEKEIAPPSWAKFVKTSRHKERPPEQKNWWHIRAASILRKLAINQPMGLTKFRNVYGGRKNRGHKPEHKYPASGNILRKILQQLEKAGYVKTEKGKGRMLTAKGKQFLKARQQTVV